MAQVTAHIKQKSIATRVLRALDPRNWFSRASYSNAAPVKSVDFWRGLFGGFNRAKVSVTETKALGIPAYWRACNIVAEQLASLHFSVYEEQEDGSIIEAKSHPLYKLLNFRPSPLYSSFDFIDTLVRQCFLRGNAYIQPVTDNRGAIIELRILQPPIELYYSKTVKDYYYKFQTEEGENLTLRWDEVLHIKPYSTDGWFGQNPLKIFNEVFGKAIAEIEYGSAYFGNGAHPSGVMIPESPMDPNQLQQAVDAWTKSTSTGENVGKTGWVPFNFKYQQLGSNLADSRYIESRNQSSVDIANITGVPLDLLNAHDKSSTYASAEQRIRQFVQFTVRTWCKRIEDEFNSKLFRGRNMGRQYVRFNLDSLQRGDTTARSQYYNIALQNGFMTANEVRRMENLNPMEGGDVLRMPLNMEKVTDEQPTDEQADEA